MAQNAPHVAKIFEMLPPPYQDGQVSSIRSEIKAIQAIPSCGGGDKGRANPILPREIQDVLERMAHASNQGACPGVGGVSNALLVIYVEFPPYGVRRQIASVPQNATLSWNAPYRNFRTIRASSLSSSSLSSSSGTSTSSRRDAIATITTTAATTSFLVWDTTVPMAFAAAGTGTTTEDYKDGPEGLTYIVTHEGSGLKPAQNYTLD
ncbi:hypothetical protein FRACYDRAFT_250674 [Fragilariopsis cylindrus CCMP1102]|uniref:Uncharacterized protein n=1 Tax=Fragilariopsis cylindrus CCMP1102 TaxID=635003 RepID=A0A1E7EPD9_9STRA|nr:hypothetical protein FRACYDRAFT_250674 [Fragilariopsis cylindrus CCMP1102]|eukprot:OEU07656.1 hypothetical protein FRACYDRAFT_250674 [Fragilariopsis cylindrus CCMP1102]